MFGLRPDLYEEPDRSADFSVTTEFVDTIPVKDWERLVRRLTKQRPLRVSVDTSYGHRHAWHCRPAWDPAEKRWEVNIHPGFVNSWETLVRIPGEDAPEATLERYGDDPPTRVDAWLSESPFIPIQPSRFRPIGDDPKGLAVESVPEYFRILGVGGGSVEVEQSLTSGISVTISGPIPDASTRRWLRACEVVLTQPRAALKMNLTDGQGEPTLQLEVDTPSVKNPSLGIRREYRGSAPVSGIEQMLAGATDRAFDERHLATIYFLSPIGAEQRDEPGPDWTPIPVHRCWFNLRHEVNQDLEVIPEQRISFPGLGLAGGVGDALIAQQTEQLSRVFAEAGALLNQSRIEGRFWSV